MLEFCIVRLRHARRWHLVSRHLLHSCFWTQRRSAGIAGLWGGNVISVDALIIHDAISGSRHGSPNNSPWRVYSRLPATFLEDRESAMNRPDPETTTYHTPVSTTKVATVWSAGVASSSAS